MIRLLPLLLTISFGHAFGKKVENTSSSSSSVSSVSVPVKYLPANSTCYRSIPNQGKIPTAVLHNIIDFVRSSPDQVFEKNNEKDLYWLMSQKLGPITTLKQRRAVMADTQIVLGALESSWNYNAGRDPATPASKPCTEYEAGMFQVSSNSMAFGSGKLTTLFKAACGQYNSLGTCQAFQKCTKEEPAFAHSYTGLLLRYTVNHHGPLLRGTVGSYLSKSCQNEIEGIL